MNVNSNKMHLWWASGPIITAIFIFVFVSLSYYTSRPPVTVESITRLSPEITCSTEIVYHQRIIIRTAPSILVSYRTIREFETQNAWYVESDPRFAVVDKPMIIERDIKWIMPSLPPPGKYIYMVGYATLQSQPSNLLFTFIVPENCN